MTRPKRILVVDDEKRNRDLMEALLQSFGYESEIAVDGAEALANLNSQVDLILLDVMMPGLDGFEVARRVRSHPEYSDVPIIMVTSLDSKKDRLDAVEAGANDFVSKPIDAVELRARMGSLLKMKEAQDVIKRHRSDLEATVETRTRALRESESRMRLLIESSPIGIAIVQQGRLSYVNPSLLRVFGYGAADEIIDLSWDSLFEASQRGTLRAKARVAASGEPVHGVDLKGLQKNGRSIELCVWLTATQFSGEPALLGFLVDVSEEKALRSQLLHAQKMEALGTLAGGIAHDFNNILFVISGYSELSLDNAPEGSQLHIDLRQILGATNRAKDLVQQILTFSRQTEQEKKPVGVGPIVKETLKFLRASVPKIIEIRETVEPDLGTILADPTQIHQVIMNLCTNAVHSMREKGGVLEVGLQRIAPDNEFCLRYPDLTQQPCLELTVTDTGHGMGPEILERIFEPYFTTKVQGEGTGLGLSVVHGIVKSHGGAIWVDSGPDKGSTFRACFPFVGEHSLVSATPEESIPTGHERVLFVDDEEIVASLGKQILESLGYEVLTAVSAAAALAVFRVQPSYFDLVITDVNMPCTPGPELAKDILKLRPDIPIILCTGFSDLISREEARSLGIRDMLIKPVLKSEMARAVRRVLDG